MQKAEAQHNHAQHQPAVRQDKGAAFESPQGERIAKFDALANGSPQAAVQRQLAGSIQNSPRMVAQGAVLQAVFGGVLQAKTDVKENLNDATDDKTSNKKINTPTQGLKWFRFEKNDKVINSFANNITDRTPKGANPVTATVDLANSDEVSDKSDIPDMSRSVHFRLGDNLQGISSGDRTGKWTWHHKVDKYKMELVDMYTHGGFYHYGGFSQWGDMDDDDDTTV